MRCGFSSFHGIIPRSACKEPTVEDSMYCAMHREEGLARVRALLVNCEPIQVKRTALLEPARPQTPREA